MKLRVVRPIHLGGVRREVGYTFDLEDGRAIEAIATGRVERAGDVPPPSPAPMTTETAPALSGALPESVGKKRKFAQKE